MYNINDVRYNSEYFNLYNLLLQFRQPYTDIMKYTYVVLQFV